MPRIIPAYRQRKGYDQAIVTLRDATTKRARDYWLGPYNTPQSRELYHRIIADWEANGRRLIEPPKVESAVPQELTVVELCRQYWDWAVGHFGQQDVSNLKLMLRVLVQMCGSSTAAGFGPNKLRQVRETMIQGDPAAKPPRRPWSRKYVNVQVQRIVRIFKWAAGRELLPVSVYQQLRTIEPLRRGRCNARETEPVRPVADELVDAIRPHVSRQVWALIELQRWTGARPCELFRLRPVDLHMEEEEVWTYSPDEHKTAYRGRQRTIYIGPRAQEVIRPYLVGRAVDVPLFSPAEAEVERRAAMYEKRITPLSCGIRHTIRSIEPEDKTPCLCIRIDAPDSLYVTDDFILTHNSSWAASSERPIFIQTEDGLGEIDCAKFPVARGFSDVMDQLTELWRQSHDFRTVVVDSLDWLERLIWQEVCLRKVIKNIEDIGYQKGYSFALDEWRMFIDALDALRRDKGMAIILIAHTKIEKFQTPEDAAFDRFSPRLHKLAAAVVMEWCDEVFFATYSSTTDPKKVKNVPPERIMRTSEGPTHVAKNRLKMPLELPLEWAAYEYFALQAYASTQQAYAPTQQACAPSQQADASVQRAYAAAQHAHTQNDPTPAPPPPAA